MFAERLVSQIRAFDARQALGNGIGIDTNSLMLDLAKDQTKKYVELRDAVRELQTVRTFRSWESPEMMAAVNKVTEMVR